jgi:D-alanine-D-alanine ligase
MPSGDTVTIGPIRLLVIAGGPSAEHTVSMMSARNVISESSILCATLLVLTRPGRWLSESQSLKARCQPRGNCPTHNAVVGTWRCGVLITRRVWEGGTGAIQGIMELERIPYLGGGIMATVLTRDKIVAKEILAAHEFP